MPFAIAILIITTAWSWIPAAAAQTETRTITITARRSIYDPTEITLKKGQPVVLIVKSLDVPHGLLVRELNIDMKVKKGGSSEVQFTPEKAGDFVGHCSVFCGSGHGSMKLTIHVVE
ncbi:MAG: cupredoxin domain-containing protein [Acidobacteriota bacterium]